MKLASIDRNGKIHKIYIFPKDTPIADINEFSLRNNLINGSWQKINTEIEVGSIPTYNQYYTGDYRVYDFDFALMVLPKYTFCHLYCDRSGNKQHFVKLGYQYRLYKKSISLPYDDFAKLYANHCFVMGSKEEIERDMLGKILEVTSQYDK